MSLLGDGEALFLDLKADCLRSPDITELVDLKGAGLRAELFDF